MYASGEKDDLNYYDILNISQNASDNEIRRAYKILALKHHPDKGGDIDKFHTIKKAFNVLINKETRDQYDFERSRDKIICEPRIPRNHRNQHNVCTATNPPNAPNAHKPKTTLKANIHRTLEITLNDIYNNKIHTINVSRYIGCDYCAGKGFVTFTHISCVLCDGRGKYFSVMGFELWCQHCGGIGETTIECPDRRCPKCYGEGHFHEQQQLFVPSYHCVMHSMKHPTKEPVVLYYGKGNRLPGRPPGDLIVHFVEKEHSNFVRKQANMHYTKYLTMYDALYGLIFDIETIDSRILRIEMCGILKTKEATIDSDFFQRKIDKEGIISPDKSTWGDLIIDFKLIVPNLNYTTDETFLKKLFLSSQNKKITNKKYNKNNDDSVKYIKLT